MLTHRFPDWHPSAAGHCDGLVTRRYLRRSKCRLQTWKVYSYLWRANWFFDPVVIVASKRGRVLACFCGTQIEAESPAMSHFDRVQTCRLDVGASMRTRWWIARLGSFTGGNHGLVTRVPHLTRR